MPVSLEEFRAALAAPPSDDEVNEAELIGALSLVEDMPDDVIDTGDAAIEEWLRARGALEPTGEIRPQFNIFACVGAVGAAILTLGPAKIVKIKSALKAAGGVVTFVRKYKRAYDAARRDGQSIGASVRRGVREGASAAGPELQEALLDLFGISAVIGACT